MTQVFRLRPYQDVYVNVVDPKVSFLFWTLISLFWTFIVINTYPQRLGDDENEVVKCSAILLSGHI